MSEQLELAVSEALPGRIEFDRSPGWGLVPEQSTGRLDGRPFYLRSRAGFATLEVYPRGTVRVPNSLVDTEEFSGAEVGGALTADDVVALVRSLSADERFTQSFLGSQCAELPARDVAPFLPAGVSAVERGGHWDGCDELLLESVYGGEQAFVTWSERRVMVVLAVPGVDLREHDDVAGRYSAEAERLDGPSVVRAVAAALAAGQANPCVRMADWPARVGQSWESYVRLCDEVTDRWLHLFGVR